MPVACTQEAEAGRLKYSPGQPGLHNESLSEKPPNHLKNKVKSEFSKQNPGELAKEGQSLKLFVKFVPDTSYRHQVK